VTSIKLLLDQDFDLDILRGLQLRVPQVDAITAFEIGLSDASDPELLAWAAENGRLLLTHDRQTMPDHIEDRLAAGGQIVGVVIVPRRIPIGRVIDDLELIVVCSDAYEWINVTRYLPLSR
jgi:hypothetical protein